MASAFLSTGSDASQKTYHALLLVIVVLLCLLAPLDLAQLIFALIGAVAYYGFQVLQRGTLWDETKLKGKKISPPGSPRVSAKRREQTTAWPKKVVRQDSGNLRQKASRQPEKENGKDPAVAAQLKPSSFPIPAPAFSAKDFNGQVAELLSQIMPTAESHKAVKKLAQAVKVYLLGILPEAQVLGFAHADLSRGKAFGVAVPDVDIVITVNQDALQKRCGSSKPSITRSPEKPEPRKLQKTSLRLCTDALVNAGGFKFRRSAFRGDEPKVTLLAPATFGLMAEAVPLDLSVNAAAPIHNAALLAECGNIDMKAKELIILVRRWVKDRGICHSPKGFLTPYIWSLLAVYFLQVDEEFAILPPLEEFEGLDVFMPGNRSSKSPQAASRLAKDEKSKDVAKMLRSFFEFYANFDWKNENICALRGKREKPPLSLPVHIIENKDGTTEAAPYIEDPFAPKVNLGACMAEWSFMRTREELTRAKAILDKESPSLSELLEPWTPLPDMAEDPEVQ
eukprot:TRINITY_DN96388_c0_g1_i1.p1 TRINITY_DN96388_c0_g1~~TRINITY_DN96388_c0_g1_i1.p1  ORF type:complete len:509 (-),score=126.17 TRINITY_DN96388_c0_g1_i1:111-1637(-)